MPTAGPTGALPESGTLAAPSATTSKTANNVALATPINPPATDAIPELSGLPTPAPDSTGENAPTEAAAEPSATAAVGAPAAAPAEIDSANSIADPVSAAATPPPSITPGSVATNLAPPPTTLPGLNLPVPGGEEATNSAPATMPAPTMPGLAASVPSMPAGSNDGVAIALPGLPPSGVTWKTKLAPAVVPPKTNFNYKRQILPDSVYKKNYGRENGHLPTAVTREDYQLQLFQRVAANDVDGTRALLNTGMLPSTTDGWGQSLLTIARRNNAHDTERLLLARGANS